MKRPVYVLQEQLVRYRQCSFVGNLSQPTLANCRRSQYEFSNVLRWAMETMPDKLFLESFRDDFVRKDARTHLQLQCERAFLLLKADLMGPVGRMHGLDRMAKLLDQPAGRKLMEEQYGMTQMDFYKLSSEPAPAFQRFQDR